jgi:myosin heavy subunit
MPQPNDEMFTSKLHTEHAENELLLAPRVSRKCKIGSSEGFIVNHFAGKVLYSSEGFVTKNMDKLHGDIETVIRSSSLVSAWAGRESEVVSNGKRSKGKTSVVSRFKLQLSELMECLGNTSANYIRCIKPTALQSPGVFDGAYVLNQLRNNGTNEALELMHKGYPTRINFETLAKRYRESMPEVSTVRL